MSDHYHGDTRGTGWRLVLASLKLDSDAAAPWRAEVDCGGCWAAIAKNLADLVATQFITMAGVPDMDHRGEVSGAAIAIRSRVR